MVSGLAKALSSCLWALVLEGVLLQPTRVGAFIAGGGGPTFLPQQYEAAVAGYATRSQHRCSRRRRRRGVRESSLLNMSLRMTPSLPHPTKVAFQVRGRRHCCKPPTSRSACLYDCVATEGVRTVADVPSRPPVTISRLRSLLVGFFGPTSHLHLRRT